VHRTQVTADAALVTNLPGSQSGIVILSDGSVVVGTGESALTRPNASPGSWRDSEALEGIPRTPLVLTGPAPSLLVTTSTGRIFSIRQSDGSVAWGQTISATNAPLQPPNVSTSAGQSGRPLSTAYVAGEDGKLYAVIVDGELDTSAPWPKAFHDPRNTNNAGTQP
jgi:hypothetical protein